MLDEETADRKRDLRARDKARDSTAKPSLAPASYAGKYEQAAYGPVRVTETMGKLELVYGNFTCPLEHFEKETFRVTAGFFEEHLVTFAVKDGKVMGVKFQGQDFGKK